MEIKSRHDLNKELKSDKCFEGWIKGSELQSCLPEMKKTQSAVHVTIVIWLLSCFIFAAFLYFIFTTHWFMQFIRENELDRSSWFQPAFFAFLGITGLLLIYFTDQATRNVRQIRTLHLLPIVFANTKADETYYFFLSLKGKFYISADKKELDTWFVLYKGGKEGLLLTLTDQSWIKLKIVSKKSKERVFSFMQVFQTNEMDALHYTNQLYDLKKSDPAPEFPGTKTRSEIFTIDPNKFRNFDAKLLGEAIHTL